MPLRSVWSLRYCPQVVQTFEMFDDTIKVKISKVDITTNEELPGAELVIKDKDGTEIDRWISTNGPHYVEKMPAGDYHDADPGPYSAPHRTRPQRRHPCLPHPLQHPRRRQTIPKTGDNSSLGLPLAIAESLAGLAVLVHKSACRKDMLRPVTMMTRTPRIKE